MENDDVFVDIRQATGNRDDGASSISDVDGEADPNGKLSASKVRTAWDWSNNNAIGKNYPIVEDDTDESKWATMLRKFYLEVRETLSLLATKNTFSTMIQTLS